MVISCVLNRCCYDYERVHVIDLFALQVEMEGGVMKHMLRVREQVSPKHSSKAGLDEDLLSMVHELSQVRTYVRPFDASRLLLQVGLLFQFKMYDYNCTCRLLQACIIYLYI